MILIDRFLHQLLHLIFVMLENKLFNTWFDSPIINMMDDLKNHMSMLSRCFHEVPWCHELCGSFFDFHDHRPIINWYHMASNVCWESLVKSAMVVLPCHISWKSNDPVWCSSAGLWLMACHLMSTATRWAVFRAWWCTLWQWASEMIQSNVQKMDFLSWSLIQHERILYIFDHQCWCTHRVRC